jgi:hypothetical protein
MTKWNLEETDMDKVKQQAILQKATRKAINVMLQAIIDAEYGDLPKILASVDFEGRIYTLEFRIEEKQE